MEFEAPVVIYDANVLFPFHVGHILTFVAFKRLVVAKWTKKIQDEWLDSFAEKFPAELEGCKRRCEAMNRAIPDAMVTGYEHRIGGIDFRDPDDRHVIAAALHAGASGIVTRDKDFTDDELKTFGLARLDPDDVLAGCYDRFPSDCITTLEAARTGLTRTKPSWEAYLATLEAEGLIEFVRRLRGWSGDPRANL